MSQLRVARRTPWRPPRPAGPAEVATGRHWGGVGSWGGPFGGSKHWTLNGEGHRNIPTPLTIKNGGGPPEM